MKTFTSFLVIAFILFFSCVKSQTWTQKLNWEIHNVYMHQDSATGVKDADVMRNGNICMLVSMNEDALNKLIVMDPSTQQQLWNHDFGKWGALTSQYARAVTATSDTGVLVCENWLSQAAGPITHGFIYKFSATGNILWIDTFLAVTSQQRIAEDIIEDANGNYLALIGDTVYVLNGTNGNINHAIMIRSFLSLNDQLHFQAGAGIVIDSIPENELNEIDHKTGALKKALTEANKLNKITTFTQDEAFSIR